MMVYLMGQFIVQIGAGGILLFKKKPTARPSRFCQNISLRPLSLDDYVELIGLSFLSAESIVNRYYKGGGCVLIYDQQELIGYVWISQTSIQRGKRVIWKQEKYEDRCVYDVWFFRGCTRNQMEEGLCGLVKENAPKGRASLFLLIEPFDRELYGVANALFVREG
jgi:hypothetical protein